MAGALDTDCRHSLRLVEATHNEIGWHGAMKLQQVLWHRKTNIIVSLQGNPVNSGSNGSGSNGSGGGNHGEPGNGSNFQTLARQPWKTLEMQLR